jgi:octaprenyl-diphosphate synthase
LRLGGYLGGAEVHQIEALKQFGLRLGSAFQMTDDTLDYVAREADSEKSSARISTKAR